MTSSHSTLPMLAVDLDGTLVRTDTFIAASLGLLRRNPLCLLPMLIVLLRGRAALKQYVAQRSSIEPGELPYNASLVDYLKDEFAAGRTIILATGSDTRLAEPIAAYLGCFSSVLASNGVENRTGRTKRLALEKTAGALGYEYIGNSRVDIPVWEGARGVLFAGDNHRLLKRVSQQFEVTRVFH